MIAALLLAIVLACQPAPAVPPTAEPSVATSNDDEDWGFPPPAPPISEAEAREAANRAAIERAEQARIESQGPPPRKSGKMICRETDVGLVCGTSERALVEQEQRLRDQLADRD